MSSTWEYLKVLRNGVRLCNISTLTFLIGIKSIPALKTHIDTVYDFKITSIEWKNFHIFCDIVFCFIELLINRNTVMNLKIRASRNYSELWHVIVYINVIFELFGFRYREVRRLGDERTETRTARCWFTDVAV